MLKKILIISLSIIGGLLLIYLIFGETEVEGNEKQETANSDSSGSNTIGNGQFGGAYPTYTDDSDLVDIGYNEDYYGNQYYD